LLQEHVYLFGATSLKNFGGPLASILSLKTPVVERSARLLQIGEVARSSEHTANLIDCVAMKIFFW